MSNIINLHFKYQGQGYGVWLKGSVEEVTLSMLEARIYKRLALDENKVKLRLSYIPLVVGWEEAVPLSDDDDLVVYLTSFDINNRRCMLFVEVINILELPEQLSRVDKSSFGMNYDELQRNDGEAQIEPNVVEPCIDNVQHEAIENGGDEDGVECEDNNMGISYTHEEYSELLLGEEHSQYLDGWEDGLGLSKGQEFINKKGLQDVVDRGAFVNSFGFRVVKSDTVRLVLKCVKDSCKWGLRAARIPNSCTFSIRRYTKTHTCSRPDQSTSNMKRKGTPQLVASLLHDDYPGQMKTPSPRIIMDLVKTKYGVSVSYSTALRGKNQAVSDLRGSPEDNYQMLRCYLHMLEKVNPGTVTSVKLDENSKFKYLFIALGASIEGFLVMRKVIIVDATFLKNGYDNVLVFALAQDGNRHHYPIAFGVLDGEKAASWNWFFEMLKTVVADSSELVFITDRNVSLINAIADVYPHAQHGYCIWHLSQNVKSHASNINKDVVAHRFIECGRIYTVSEFDIAYSAFTMRYPSAAEYLENTTEKKKWARCYFPGERFNIDTSNSCESVNSVFREARKYSLIPMLDTILKKFSDWFNQRRKDAVDGSDEHKLVPVVANHLHDLCVIAKKLIATELNSFELEYNVTGSDGKHYMVSLSRKSCSCRMFDIDRYPCVHALAALVEFQRREDKVRNIEIHELCSKFFWTEIWAMAYYKTIYLVPDRSEWDVPTYIKEVQIHPPDRKEYKGRKKVKRFPSVGERRPRTQNKRRPRQNLEWLLFGDGGRD